MVLDAFSIDHDTIPVRPQTMLKPAIVRPSDIVPPVEILPVGKAGEVVVRVKGAVNGLVNVSSVSETNDGQDDKFNPEKTKQLITENYHGEETLLMGRSRPFDNLGTKIISETGNRGFIVVPTASWNIIWFGEKGQEYMNLRKEMGRLTPVRKWWVTQAPWMRIITNENGTFSFQVLKDTKNIPAKTYNDDSAIFDLWVCAFFIE